MLLFKVVDSIVHLRPTNLVRFSADVWCFWWPSILAVGGARHSVNIILSPREVHDMKQRVRWKFIKAQTQSPTVHACRCDVSFKPVFNHWGSTVCSTTQHPHPKIVQYYSMVIPWISCLPLYKTVIRFYAFLPSLCVCTKHMRADCLTGPIGVSGETDGC